MELRFWFIRPENLPEPAEERLRSEPVVPPMTPLESALEDMFLYYFPCMCSLVVDSEEEPQQAMSRARKEVLACVVLCMKWWEW